MAEIENAELVREVLFIVSLLSGFSFAVVAQFVLLSGNRRIASWTISVFALPALALLVGLFSVILPLIGTARFELKQQLGPALDSIYFYNIFLNLTAAIVFIGIYLAGWLRSGMVNMLAIVLSLAIVFTMLALIVLLG